MRLPVRFLALCALAFAPFTFVHAQGAKDAIRHVDFRNFSYRVGEEQQQVIHTKNGEYSVEEPEEDRMYFQVFGRIAYGDLTGDGSEEAVVVTNTNTGGTGQFTDGWVFTMRAGKPVLLEQVGAGDRADGGIHTVDIRGGQLIVERYGHGDASGACCPEWVDVDTLKWNGKSFAQVGKLVREPWTQIEYGTQEPVHRLQFPKGQTSTVVCGATEATAVYTAGARAGQTMTVRVWSQQGDARFSIETPDGQQVGSGVDGATWTGALPKSGDTRISISGTGDTGTRYSLQVGIR